MYYFVCILNCSDEMQHVSSGVQQLEKQEKAAHFSLLAEEQQCTKLLSRVSSAQEELLKWLHCLAKLPAEFKNLVIFVY
jgi:fatty acid/phospholipid biosynthesis enzyme